MVYFHRKLELNIRDDCLLWGKRLIIPQKKQLQLLEELHIGHLDICKMKAFARSSVWWPGLYSDIEGLVADYEACKVKAASTTPHVAAP